jgi:hypothetical protein
MTKQFFQKLIFSGLSLIIFSTAGYQACGADDDCAQQQKECNNYGCDEFITPEVVPICHGYWREYLPERLDEQPSRTPWTCYRGCKLKKSLGLCSSLEKNPCTKPSMPPPHLKNRD